MKAPTFWHMAFASLVSAFSWTPLGRGKTKGYLTTQKNDVLNSDAMRGALHDALTGTPDTGQTKRRYYHHWKDLWPTFLETATSEEMPSKYHSFATAVPAFILGFVAASIISIAIKLIL